MGEKILIGIDPDNIFNVKSIDIINNVFKVDRASSDNYDRVWAAVRKWAHVRIEFNGTYYDDNNYLDRVFAIINTAKLGKNNIYIELNKEFLHEMFEKDDFHRRLSTSKNQEISALALRLFKILDKSFGGKNTHPIKLITLARKIPLRGDSYPSSILRKLYPALEEINAKTDLKLSWQYIKKDRLIIFNKLTNADYELLKQEKEKELQKDLFEKTKKSLLNDEGLKKFKEYLTTGKLQSAMYIRSLKLENMENDRMFHSFVRSLICTEA